MLPQSSDDAWLEDIMRCMFSQARTSPLKDQSNCMTEDEVNSSQAAKDARRMARMAMQMAIGALNAADAKQDLTEKTLHSKLAAEKKEKEVLQRRITEDLERRDEVERMRRAMEQMKQQEKEQERLREELKREKWRREQDMERELAEQKAAEELMKAKEELNKAKEETKKMKEETKKAKEEAKKSSEEAARARQEAKLAHERAERAEEAQKKQSAQGDSTHQSKEQVHEIAAWAKYTDQWELFKRFSLVAGADAGGGVFRFEDIPWPTVTPPASPTVITKKEVEGFLFSSHSSQNKPLKTRIRECLLIWHPDKFSGRWMRFVIEADRAKVIEGVSAVTRAGNELMADYANRRKTM